MKTTSKSMVVRVEKTRTLSLGKFIPAFAILEYDPQEGLCRRGYLNRARLKGKTVEEYLNEQADLLEEYAKQLRAFVKDDSVKYLNLGLDVTNPD